MGGAELVRLLVQARNGRFLKEEGSGWSEVPDIMARTKVATCFRTARHRKKKASTGAVWKRIRLSKVYYQSKTKTA
jgi:hypothetical protein